MSMRLATPCWVFAVAASAGCAGAAHAGYLCQDGWGQIYRLPVATVGVGEGLTCTRALVPERAEKPALSAAEARVALSIAPLPASGARRRGRLVMQVEAPVSRSAQGDASTAQPFDPLISAAAQRYGHDARLIKAIVFVESRFDPSAVSPKGAVGLMQLMPATASELGVELPTQRLLDPALNLDTGARHLRRLMDTFADRPELAIAAYNAGEGAVLKYGRRVPPYAETQNYVREVLAQFDKLRLRDRARGAPGM
jgi:soluble lytic murein transglycosylase-like protein